MDYKGQSELLLKDAAEFAEYNVPGYIVGDLRQASKSITDLLARAEAAEARAEKAERERDAAVKCIEEIEDALNFKRMSAIGLRISEWRGRQKEE